MHTIKARQAIAFSILLLGLLVGGLLGFRSLRWLSEEFQLEMGELERVAEIGNALQRDVLDLIFSAEGYLASGDRQARQRFDELAGRIQEEANRYRELERLSAEDARLVEGLTASLTQLEVDYARAHALYDLGRREEARRLADAVQPTAREAARLISELGARRSEVIAESTAALQGRASQRALYVLFITFLAVALGAVLAVAVVRSIDRPLAQLVYAARELGTGRLRTLISNGNMPSEFSELGQAFNTMATNLRSLAAQVASTATQVSSSAADFSAISDQVAASTNEVATAMTEISDGAERQAHALNETAAAVLELREGTSRLETEASENRELSHSISREAAQSQESVRQALQLLLTLREVVHRTGEEVEGLESASEKISGFVRRITQIAEQTHLLSLNAAIEAAHAGHEGRGFGVVAEEVRKLASEADGAAQDVEEVVAQLRDWISGTVAKMREGEQQVLHVETVARGAEGALDTIAGGLGRVTEATDHAVLTANRSRTLLEQVAGHVESVTTTATSHASRSQDVSAAIQQQTATTEEISASVAELVAAAEQLRRLVGEWEV
ncbi:MAG: methyl-accepting chemotaxis protein [Gemmatimonadetes bacterium]|uniref:Methyl-accepting chemotaxis protein n=1 Tax=Candidatus Kutchimonas denitrificans TaxID=3056748 RepID=A0AAE4Z7D7_9BACT|nr:methyl-accepting chemotaxis protein [Gemmatimonadota bacterium]NIR74067.1 methyl-accepting chemotaxis protein [Candidatus Kutchimonas denitrificans]NIS01629.1 methyl-accepting chemotaxis protein [Gemmatimonadota bacterium]NIT67367.1 methyl-accepting chemotaxis protein [Gemmatimonadota bacterium]NIU52730.1 HAMP domain-containing protein [Gemmatimonadota bacterium]